MRILRYLILVCGLGALGLVGLLKLYVLTFVQPPVTGQIAGVVVLSAGPINDTKDGRTSVRTRVGVQLYNRLRAEGQTPKLVLAGGQEHYEWRPKAVGMAEIAREMGVPDADILIEGRSRSTLQNAMFSYGLLNKAPEQAVAIITDRFHLPRSWASFKWAGEGPVILVSAEEPEEDVDWDNLFREAPKWPLNFSRAILYSALRAAGWPEEDVIHLTN